jgi:hypothetical protein
VTLHVEQPEPIDITVARMAALMPAPTYWVDRAGRWVAYQGRGIYERGTWERGQWVTLMRIQPREEWG